MIYRKLAFAFCLILFFIFGVWFYAVKIETHSLSITYMDIVNKQVRPSFHGLKIVQFSDTHLGPAFSIGQLQALVARINKLQPDIVVFSGDLMDHYAQYGSENRAQAKQVLEDISAPLGKFAVFGNHDRGGGASRSYKPYMEEAGFTVLVNQVHTITFDTGDKLTIAGLDDFLLGHPQVNRTLQSLRTEDYNLLLVHQPDVAEQFLDYPVDLQLSGHSHGGQIRLPLLKPLLTTSLADKYVEGEYSLEGKYRPLTLYVNRGIGTTRQPLRLFAKPELTVMQLLSD